MKGIRAVLLYSRHPFQETSCSPTSGFLALSYFQKGSRVTFAPWIELLDLGESDATVSKSIGYHEVQKPKGNDPWDWMHDGNSNRDRDMSSATGIWPRAIRKPNPPYMWNSISFATRINEGSNSRVTGQRCAETVCPLAGLNKRDLLVAGAHTKLAIPPGTTL